MDETSVSTLTLLEARLLRIEHLLHGQTSTPAPGIGKTATQRMIDLERRFYRLVSDVRAHGDLLKIYRSHPDWFHTPGASEPPSDLSIDEIQAIVLSAASSYTATLSALTAVQDSPVPDPAESANLISLGDKMKAVEATQIAQRAEIAELRRRSEIVIRLWYEGGVLQTSQSLADLEGRMEMAERRIRRVEHRKEEEKAL
ncbi:hypothetical protein HJFPF1_01810 [Paramyrothecium foliicola]|nr:hypothetical protein HJFPF1_01810 [Paramyrothecium foliicola]